MSAVYQVKSIGEVRAESKGIYIKLEKQYIPALRELEGFSHMNVYWWFSENDYEEARNVLETPAPYKNSPKVMGTFATRSPFRPNPLAVSVVSILNIDMEEGIIYIDYTDAFDKSPVLDIKPYTPSIDRIENPKVPDWCSHWPMSVESSGDFDWEGEFNF